MTRRVDPALLEGEELERWYLRTPEELERERALAEREAYDAYFGVGGLIAEGDAVSEEPPRWQQVKVSPRTAPAVRPPPPAPERIAPGISPYAPNGQGASGFFDGRRPVPSPSGDAYLTDLPSPLNYVRPRFGGWYELGDGTMVRGSVEVDRIHAEQQAWMTGQGETPPAARVRTVDRLPDGQIPAASQLAKKERELDPTCHPNGGWELDPQFPTNAQWTQDYEAQITRAPELDYVVRNPGESPVKFDGCAVWTPRHPLLEAKGPGIAPLLTRAMPYPFYANVVRKRDSQSRRQAAAAQGRPIDVHVAERGALPFFQEADRAEAMTVLLTPPR